MLTVATVRLLDIPYRADKDFDYLLPSENASVSPGRLLLVPFGKSNRPVYAVLTAVTETDTASRPLKAVLSVLPEDYRVLPEILRLCFFLRDHTLCSVGDAYGILYDITKDGLPTGVKKLGFVARGGG